MTNYDKAIGTTYLGWADYDQINYVSMNDLAAGRRPENFGTSALLVPLQNEHLRRKIESESSALFKL